MVDTRIMAILMTYPSNSLGASFEELFARGKAKWEAYQQEHDVRHLHGQVVAIDLETGDVYFGPNRYKIDADLRAAGLIDRPLYLTGVGIGYYSHMRPRRRVWSSDPSPTETPLASQLFSAASPSTP